MPIAGIPAEVEMMIEAVSRQKIVTSYKVFGEKFSTVIVLRFGNNYSKDARYEEETTNMRGTFRRKTQSQLRRDRQRAEQRKNHRQQEIIRNDNTQFEASDTTFNVIADSYFENNNDDNSRPINVNFDNSSNSRPTLPVQQSLNPVPVADYSYHHCENARADRVTTDSGFINLDSSAEVCEQENISVFFGTSDNESGQIATEHSTRSESGSLPTNHDGDDDNSSLSTKSLNTVDGEKVYPINNQHYVGESTMETMCADITADAALRENLLDDHRNIGFLKMATTVSNDMLELLCESDDLMFLIGIDEESICLSAQYHFFVKKDPSKRRPLERNVLLMLSRLNPFNDNDNLRHDAERLLRSTLTEVRCLLQEC